VDGASAWFSAFPYSAHVETAVRGSLARLFVLLAPHQRFPNSGQPGAAPAWRHASAPSHVFGARVVQSNYPQLTTSLPTSRCAARFPQHGTQNTSTACDSMSLSMSTCYLYSQGGGSIGYLDHDEKYLYDPNGHTIGYFQGKYLYPMTGSGTLGYIDDNGEYVYKMGGGTLGYFSPKKKRVP